PCGECGPCLRVANKSSEGVLLVEPAGNNIKLEAATAVLDFLSLQRVSRARVVIVEQAQLLNPQTGNALLKVIEEPPPESHFILLVSEISQLLPTLRSRVQNVRFSPLNDDVLKRAHASHEWMVRAARGSFSQLEALNSPEVAELRQLAVDFLTDAGQDLRRSLEKTVLETKERESALQFARLMQQILRDWTVLEGGGDVLNVDLKDRLSGLPKVDARSRAELWRQAFQVEMDLLAHVDRALVLENFFYRARQALR
ncbi:MAG TPA: hypothetical protein PKC28_01590, partial [Bdellovibrionales bacterium]|nr:hypothetical protein [Bdellovibrionales bacterium]